MQMTRTQLTDEIDVSRLIYGMWRLIDDGDDSPKTVQAKLEACLDRPPALPELFSGYHHHHQ